MIFMNCGYVNAYSGKEKIAPLSYKVKQTPADYKLNSDEYNVSPLEDSSLNFKVNLPQGWQPMDSDLNKGNIGGDIFHLLAMYMGPPSFAGRSQFRVRSLDINYLISAENWLISYMLDMGFVIEGMKVFSRDKVEAQYTIFIHDTPYVVRTKVEISGNRIVIAEYMVPQDNYELEKSNQILSINSYNLISPDKKPPVDIKTYSFADISRFDYPINWELIAPVITNVDDMSVTLTNISERLTTSQQSSSAVKLSQMNARIDISIIARRDGVTLQNQIDFLKKEQTEQKIKLNELIETIDDISSKSLKGKIQVNIHSIEGLERRLVDHEYWETILQTPGHFYLIRLVTVGRSKDYNKWAQNIETFRFVINSISPQRDALD